MEHLTPSPTRRAAASRQKSCNLCVQTKSRCDRRAPVCARCAQKGLCCSWGKQTRTTARQPGAYHQETEAPIAPDPPLVSADYLRSADGGLMPQSLMLDGFIGHEDMGLSGFMDFTSADGGSMPSPGQWRMQTEGSSPSNQLPTPPEGSGIDPQEYRKMASFCDYLEPWHLHDPSSTAHRALSRVKAFIGQMATRNTTPFIHPLLYQHETPDCIVSCFSTCVLYSNRTPANTAQVMRALYSSVTGLLETEANRFMATPLEKIARTQALLLYQVIRLFDGDIALRARADKDMPVLRAWLVELCDIRDNLDTLVQLGDDMCNHPPGQWKTWIFDESVRRTILMAYSVVFLYELIKDPGYREASGPWGRPNRWFLSRSLWEAGSDVEFFQIWKKKPHFIVSNYELMNFIERVRGEDVDEFASIVLNVYIGTDTTKQFVYSQDTRTYVRG